MNNRLKQLIRSVIAFTLTLSLVLSQDVLVMAKEVSQKTAETIENQVAPVLREKEQEEYLEENNASGDTEKSNQQEEQQEEQQKEQQKEQQEVHQEDIEAPEESLALPELTSDVTDTFDKLYGEPVEVNEYGKIYKVDGENYKFIGTGESPVYTDEDGKQKEIDDTLIEKQEETSFFSLKEPETYYTNKASDIEVSLPTKMSEDTGITLTNEKEQTLELYPLEGDYSKPASLENAVRYNEVFPQIDVQYTINHHVTKEDIIIKEPQEKHTFTYGFSNQEYKAKLENNVITIYAKADKEKEALFYLSAPVMTDAAGASSEEVTLGLEEKGDEYQVTVDANSEWLSDTERNYPVKVDPTITIPSSNLSMVTTSSEKGTYSAAAFGYVGMIDDAVSGVANTNLGRTRMYYKLNYNFNNLIPEEGAITSASLNLYQYSAYVGTNTFACYRLKSNWNPTTINWDNSVNIGREIAGEDATKKSAKGWQKFDIRQSVNDWVNGLAPQYGLAIIATSESTRGAAFYTPYSNTSVQPSYKPEYAPYVEINWNYPDPVPADYPLNDTKVNLRSMIDCDMSGKLAFMGVFADGIATPESEVTYNLSDTSKGYTGTVPAGHSKKYPNTKDFESAFSKNTTKYRDKLGNWQTTLPFTEPTINDLYQIEGSATKDGTTGTTGKSDQFTVYQVKQFDTMPKIAAYYGIPLSQIVYDNRMQDMLLVENNTIFIRNPRKNANQPYNPPPLSDADKEKIDKQLMGRGLHCEFGFEPVNLNTGNFYFQNTDATIPDYNGDFAIGRDYNSKGAAYISAFGRGWQFSYGEYISQKADGTLLYTRGDGSTLAFTKEEDGTYTAPEGYDLTLEKVKVGEKKYAFDGEKEETYPVYEYEITDTDHIAKRFDCYGSLKTITDEKGNQTKLVYDENANLKTITSAGGATYGFTCSEAGMITKIQLPNGGTLSYAYDENNNLTSFTDAKGATIRYEYDDKHQMTAWYDGNGTKIIDNTYDEEGRVTTQLDANGHTASFVYQEDSTTTTDGNGNETTYMYDDQYRTKEIQYSDGTKDINKYEDNRLVSETNAMGQTTTYAYNDNGDVVKETRVDGAEKTYTYDDDHHMLSETNYSGNTTTYEYDREGNMLESKIEGVLEAKYTYDGQGRTLTCTDALNHKTTYTYSGPRLTGFTDAAGKTSTMSYDAMGLLTSMTDGAGNITSYTYNLMGEKLSETDGSGAKTTYVMDAAGQLASETDGNGYTTSYTYDGLGNMTSATDAEGGIMTFAYDGNSNCIKEVDQEGNETTKTFNTRNQMLTETDSEGHTEHYTYDALNHVLKETDGKGLTTTYVYDYGVDKVKKETDPEGNTLVYEYDEEGNLLSTTYSDGSKEEQTYDKWSRVATKVDGLGLTTTYSYDEAGNLLKEEAGDQVTAYTYDAMNRVVKTTYADGGVEKKAYDGSSNVVSITDPLDEKTTYTYDGAGRVLTATDAKGGVTKYAYDGNGNQTSVINANGSETKTKYNAYDQPETVTDPLGNVTTYTYTPGELVQKITDAKGGETTYEYNSLGLPVSSKDAKGNETAIAYDANGNYASVTAADGAVTKYTYNGRDQVIKEEDAEGLVTEHTYDTNGQVLHTWDNAGTDIHYTYDGVGNVLTETNSLNQTTTYEYDKYSNLVKMTEPDGNVTKYTYDAMNQVSTITDPEGKTTTYTYDLAGNMTTTVDDAMREYRYVYDALGQVTEEKNPLGEKTSYVYDKIGQVTETTDADGNTKKTIYDKKSQVIGEIDALGNTTSYEYDPLGNVARTINAEGGEELYTYDAVNNLTSYKDAKGNETTYGYDSRNQMNQKKMPTGGVYEYAYDSHGAVTEEVNPSKGKTTYTNDLHGQTIKEVLPNKATYGYEYDKLQRLIKEKQPEGLSTSYAYDISGNLIKETDQSGRSMSYEYDKMHRLTSTTNALGQKNQYTYDKQGNLAKSKSPMGYETTYQYDALDRIQKMTNPTGVVTENTYDVQSNLKKMVENGERTTSYTYDAESNETSVTNALGETTTSKYDAMNRLSEEKNAAGEVTKYGYDKTGQMTEIIDALGSSTKMTYDANGNLTSLKDDTGRATTYEYDKEDRMISATAGAGTNKASTVEYTYDSVGNLAAQTDGNGNSTNYTYNKLGAVTSETNALGQVQRYEYDKNAMLSKVTKADKSTITYDYNKLDELLKTSYSEEDEGSVLYTYDQEGRRVSMSDLTGTSSYTYDEMGRITGVQSGDGSIIKYTYDDYGNISQLTYPDGSKVKYEYDALDRLTKVTDRNGKNTKYTYDTSGNLVKTKRGDGSLTKLTYDSVGQVLTLKNYDKKEKLISSYTYTYDLSGNILTEDIKQDGKTTSWQYAYNSRGELEEAKATGEKTETLHYSYDQAGNKVAISQSVANAQEHFSKTIQNTYNSANQLTHKADSTEGTTEYTYDANGNRVRELQPDETVKKYSYDTENRLRAIKDNRSLLQSALYDGDGNRIFVANRKIVNGSKQNKKTVTIKNHNTKDNDEEDEESDSEQVEDQTEEIKATSTKDSLDNKKGNDGKKEEHAYFAYGFTQSVVEGYRVSGTITGDAIHKYWDGLVNWYHVRIKGDWPDEDGVVKHPTLDLPDPEEKEDFKAALQDKDETSDLYSKMMIPSGRSKTSRDTYELTTYINDINQEYTQTLLEYNSNTGDVESIYEYGTDRLSYYDGEENSLYAYTYSGDGSVSELTGAISDDVVNYSYDPYGIVSVDGQTNNQYDYNGEYTDYLTGNQYLRARYYDPDTGSFTTSDTYSGDQYEPQSQNRYTYAGNDPVNTDDPSGHGWLKKQIKKAKKAVKKVQKKVVKKVQKVVKKVKKVVKKAKKVVKKAKKYVKKKAKAAKKRASKLYKKARKAAKSFRKKVCTSTKRIAKTLSAAAKKIDWKAVKKVAIGVAAVAVSVAAVALTGGAAAALVVATLNLTAGSLGAAVVSGAVIGAIGGASYSYTKSLLSGNDAETIVNDTVHGTTSGAIVGGATGAIGYGVSQVATKLSGLGNNGPNRVENTYSPVNPGPLKPQDGNSFNGATYTETTLAKDTTFYRVHGGEAEKVGSYMSRTPQNGGLQSQLDLALRPEWGNTAENVTKVTVPKGTTIYEGTAAPQIINGGTGTLPGGGNQIFIPREELNSSWFGK